MTNIIGQSREVKLIAHCSGELKAEQFTIVETTIDEPGPHQVLVRNRWFRVSISTRLMADEGAEAVKGMPFPPLKPKDTLMDAAIGEVVAVGRGVDLSIGSLVMHPFGWRDYAVVAVDECMVLASENVDPAAWLGHGWTAYAALTAGIQINEGDTVFVSSGAGAIGSMAGQIARLLGAKRVLGSTSTLEKAHWMKTELGYDEVIIRNNGFGSIREQLTKVAVAGIDVIVDMVGGEQLETALSLANVGARCVLLGALTAELNPNNATLKAPVELDSFQLILKGVTLRGFSACEAAPAMFDAWIQQLAAWRREGVIHLAHTTIKGIASAPLALQEACAGRLKGLVLVELAPR